MTDLVERLRERSGGDHDEIISITTSDLMEDAADEIERLRAALERIVSLYPDSVVRTDPIGIMFETAKAALQS